MTDEQAEEAAAKVVARAKAESLSIRAARAYAAELGLEITPVAMEGDRVVRRFVFVTVDGLRRKTLLSISGLSGLTAS